MARITGGFFRYEKNSLAMTAVTQIETTVVGGAIERDEGGRMVALVELRAPIRSIRTLLEKLGLTKVEMVCQDNALSTTQDRPSVFIYVGSTTIPAGEEMLDVSAWQMVTVPENLHIKAKLIARGFLIGNRFAGRIEIYGVYDEGTSVTAEGDFELYLS